MTKHLVLAAAFALFGGASAQAALLTNGDFENPPIGPNNVAFFSMIPGWTATVNFIEIQSNFVLGGGTPSGN